MDRSASITERRAVLEADHDAMAADYDADPYCGIRTPVDRAETRLPGVGRVSPRPPRVGVGDDWLSRTQGDAEGHATRTQAAMLMMDLSV